MTLRWQEIHVQSLADLVSADVFANEQHLGRSNLEVARDNLDAGSETTKVALGHGSKQLRCSMPGFAVR